MKTYMPKGRQCRILQKTYMPKGQVWYDFIIRQVKIILRQVWYDFIITQVWHDFIIRQVW